MNNLQTHIYLSKKRKRACLARLPARRCRAGRPGAGIRYWSNTWSGAVLVVLALGGLATVRRATR